MKTLKFRPKLVQKVLDGSKTVTWRLFDDKDLRVGDKLELLNWETKEKFAKAEIVDIQEKNINSLTKADLIHDGFINHQRMMESMKKYYGDRVSDNTIIKIIKFKLI